MPTFKNDVTGTQQIAIVGTSAHHHGVAGESKEDGAGLLGVSRDGEGVSGFSKTGPGVVGQSDQAAGVRALSKPGPGVEGLSETGDAIVGTTDSGIGVSGSSSTSHGVSGHSESGSGVRGVSKSGRGVEGWSESAYGVSGDSTKSAGVRGTSVEGRGVEGWATRSEGVFGISVTGTGVWGVAGRSRFAGKSTLEAGIFRIGSSARQWAGSQILESTGDQDAADAPRPTAMVADLAPSHADASHTEALSHSHGDLHHEAIQAAHQHQESIPETPLAGTMTIGTHSTFPISEGISHLDLIDDGAGVGVHGEHRRAGIGVKAVSNSGMGLAAYSSEHEAVHAETHSRGTAAIAAYNLNVSGTGAAVFAKKAGTRGHAGFFDGRVWVGGELAVGGDIVLANADCAEDFDVTNVSVAEPGTVMVIGDDGVLQPGCQPYDTCVVGVISGAGDYKPALTLDKQASQENRRPVALLGKVCCKVTAEYGAIEAGDLLTTSPVSGYAMKSNEPLKAFGAVIGKALRPLKEGRGLIPIVIALQ